MTERVAADVCVVGAGYARGCTMAHYAPAVLTRDGRLLREPLGRAAREILERV